MNKEEVILWFTENLENAVDYHIYTDGSVISIERSDR